MATLSNKQAESEGEGRLAEELLPRRESPFRRLALVLIEQAIDELKAKRERDLLKPQAKRRSRAQL